jgi:hypothetical protein
MHIITKNILFAFLVLNSAVNADYDFQSVFNPDEFETGLIESVKTDRKGRTRFKDFMRADNTVAISLTYNSQGTHPTWITYKDSNEVIQKHRIYLEEKFLLRYERIFSNGVLKQKVYYDPQNGTIYCVENYENNEVASVQYYREDGQTLYMEEKYSPDGKCSEVTRYNSQGLPFMKYVFDGEEPHVEHYE